MLSYFANLSQQDENLLLMECSYLEMKELELPGFFRPFSFFLAFFDFFNSSSTSMFSSFSCFCNISCKSLFCSSASSFSSSSFSSTVLAFPGLLHVLCFLPPPVRSTVFSFLIGLFGFFHLAAGSGTSEGLKIKTNIHYIYVN